MSRKPVWPPTVYRHSSGQARIRVNGRVVYLGAYGSELARREYERVVREVEQTGATPAPAGPCGVTVAAVCAAYLADQTRERGDADRELQTIRRCVAALVRVCGPMQAEAFDTDALEKLRDAMVTGSWLDEEERDRLDKRRMKPGWCRNVTNRMVVRVRSLWAWAERKKFVRPGAAAHLKTLPKLSPKSQRVRQTAKREPAGYDELRAVRSRAPRVVAYMLTVQWWTGARSGEVREMKVGEIDRTDAACWVYRPLHHKTEHLGQTRAIPLGRLGMRIVALLSEGKGPDDFVFTPRQLRRQPCYTRYSYALAVRRAARAAGVPGFHPYRLRHAARLRITREFGLDAARAVLGHASLGTTLDYAAATDLETARKVMRDRG